MSDSPTDLPAAAPDAPAPLDFEHAELAEPAAAHLACGICQRPITTEYWQSLGKVLCDTCRRAVAATAGAARGGPAFGKALLLGGGAALGCGIGYAVFVGVTNIQFALVTIGIGWAVGRAVQKATRGFGSVRHQVLAVALTYFASTMGYLPAIYKAIHDHADASRQVMVAVLSAAFMLAAPFIEITSGLNGVLGLLIIFFGLRTAWRVSRGVEATMTGPHQVTAGS